MNQSEDINVCKDWMSETWRWVILTT